MTSNNKIARFSGLLLASLSTGVLFGTRTALGPSSKSFTTKTYVEVQQATVRNLRPVMGMLMPGAVVTNLAVLGLSARERRSPAFALMVAGILGNVTALTLTGLFEFPINARVLTWSPDAPPRAGKPRWNGGRPCTPRGPRARSPGSQLCWPRRSFRATGRSPSASRPGRPGRGVMRR